MKSYHCLVQISNIFGSVKRKYDILCFPSLRPVSIISSEGLTRNSAVDLLRSEKCVITAQLLSQVLFSCYCHLLLGRICEEDS